MVVMFIDWAMVLFVVLNFIILSSSRISRIINMLIIQSMILAFYIIFKDKQLHLSIITLGLVTFFLKGVIFPYLLNVASRSIDLKYDSKQIVGPMGSSLFGLLFLSFAFYFISQFKVVTPELLLVLEVSVFTMLVGLFLIIARKKAVVQVMGFLLMENGIYLFGTTLVGEIPLLIEFGLLLDLFPLILIMGMIIRNVGKNLKTTDVNELETLQG